MRTSYFQERLNKILEKQVGMTHQYSGRVSRLWKKVIFAFFVPFVEKIPDIPEALSL